MLLPLELPYQLALLRRRRRLLPFLLLRRFRRRFLLLFQLLFYEEVTVAIPMLRLYHILIFRNFSEL
jgi:hypothetical protein